MLFQTQDYNFWLYTLSAIPQTLAAMFALVIAVLVYRLSAADKTLERDIIKINPFLFPIFKEIEIHEIEGMRSVEILAKLNEAIDKRLKEEDDNLGLSAIDYINLHKLYKLKIDEYHRFYEPDKKRIFHYIKHKRDKIDFHTKVKQINKRVFYWLSIFTGLTIFVSLFFLRNYDLFPSCANFIINIILAMALINVFFIILGIMAMVFTKEIKIRFPNLYSQLLKI